MDSGLPIIYGFAHLCLMAFIGFGGLSNLDLPFSLLVFLYFSLLLFSVYILLARCSKKTRNHVRYAIFAPWGFILFITIPQISHDGGGVLLICAISVLIWNMYILGELIVEKLCNKL